jgi:hypothetical protein
MTLERIAEAAIAIADAEGLAAVSMQPLMLEQAIGEAPALATADWRAALAEWTGLLLDAYVRHPWAAEATGGARPIGPHEMSWMERALTALPAAGLAGTERLDVVAVLAGHARATASLVTSRQREADLGAAIGAVLREHAERFPAVAAAMADGAGGGQEQSFAFGLARILDGLQVLIDQRNAC